MLRRGLPKHLSSNRGGLSLLWMTLIFIIMSKEYYVYIMTNRSGTLYTGVTGDLVRRVYEHKNKLVKGFTRKYNIQFLIYYESTSNVYAALEREKQIKGWTRAKKIALIDAMNPEWKDLSEEWFGK